MQVGTVDATEEAVDIMRRYFADRFPVIDDKTLRFTAEAVIHDGHRQEDAEIMLETMQAVICGGTSESREASPQPTKSVVAAPSSTTYLADEDVILYTTSVTDSRQVRDHCRQVALWLYLLKIKHHVMDVSDNPFMRKRITEQCGGRILPLPLLFVGTTFVGDFAGMEEKVEEEALLPVLQAMGYQHKPEEFDMADPSLERYENDTFE